MQTSFDFTSNESYFNTTNLSGSDLEESTGKATTQELQVENVFRSYPDSNFIRDEIIERIGADCYTSIGRAITVLFKKGILIKTENKRLGSLFNKTQYAYKLNR